MLMSARGWTFLSKKEDWQRIMEGCEETKNYDTLYKLLFTVYIDHLRVVLLGFFIPRLKERMSLSKNCAPPQVRTPARKKAACAQINLSRMPTSPESKGERYKAHRVIIHDKELSLIKQNHHLSHRVIVDHTLVEAHCHACA